MGKERRETSDEKRPLQPLGGFFCRSLFFHELCLCFERSRKLSRAALHEHIRSVSVSDERNQADDEDRDENAVFGQPEVGLGITPGFGGTQRLARLVGAGMAKQMIYTARNIKADEAYRIGLVNAVYPQEELMAQAKKLAAGIAAQAPIAVRHCKKAINEGLQVDMDQAIVIEEKLVGDCFETEDQKAGMGNFLEKDKEKKLKVVPFKNC